jgi:hypothetical protein
MVCLASARCCLHGLLVVFRRLVFFLGVVPLLPLRIRVQAMILCRKPGLRHNTPYTSPAHISLTRTLNFARSAIFFFGNGMGAV